MNNLKKMENLIVKAKNSSEENWGDIGDEVDSFLREIEGEKKHEFVALIRELLNLEFSHYYVNQAIWVLEGIGGRSAESLLLELADYYDVVEDSIGVLAREKLASVNPEKYLSSVDGYTQFSVIRNKIRFDNTEGFQDLIQKHSNGVNLVDEMDMTLLWEAVNKNNLEVARILVESGVDLDQRNCFGETVVEYSQKHFKNEVGDYLSNL
jgi:Ankyrin repeat